MRKLHTFYILVITQTLSLIGSRMTSIAVGIWVFTETGETAPLLLTAFFNEVPGMLGASLAGVLVDRWDRRHVLMLADGGQALATGALAVSLASGGFQLWHLYLAALVQGVFALLQQPATDASVTMLVPEIHRERANAVRQMAFPLAGVIAPVLTGLLYTLVNVVGVMLVDLMTFVVAVGAVYAIRIPRPKQSAEGLAAKGTAWREVVSGFRYLAMQRALLGLVVYLAFVNFLLNGPLELAIPYIITVTGDEASVGLLLGVMSLGAFCGATTIAVWGGTRPRMHTLMLGLMLTGAMLTVYGVTRTPVLMGMALFALMFPLPIANALFTSVMQVKTPPDMQGRVFAAVFQMAFAATPISFLLTGPLVDNVLEPAVGGPGWEVVAPVVGSEPGAGMALVLVGVGCIVLLTTAGIYAVPSIRHLEANLPDYEAVAEG